MSEFDQSYNPFEQKEGSIVLGFVGALLGALIGAVIWAVVGILGYMASIVGVAIGFLSSKGYDLLKGRPGAAKIVSLILCVVIAVAVGTAGMYLWAINGEYDTQFAELSAFEQKFVMTKGEYVQSYIDDPDFMGEVIKDALVGLFFAALGAAGVIIDAGKKKQQPATDGSLPGDAFPDAPVKTADELAATSRDDNAPFNQ